MGMVNDLLRTIIFGISRGLLFLFDMVWTIIKRVVTLDISPEIAKWFALIITLVVLFIVLRLFKIMTKTMFDEDYRAKLNVSQLIIKICLASFSIGAIPIGFSYLNQITIDFVGHIEYFIPSAVGDIDKMKPSDIILQSGRINTESSDSDLSPKITVDEKFDINEKTKIRDENGNEEEVYKYFPNYSSLFILLLSSLLATVIFGLIAISLAQRIFVIAYKYVLAPYPISGLIDQEDKSFSTWLKMLLGDYMMNFAQLYGMYLTLFICNNANLQRTLGSDAVGIFAKILILLAGLLAVNNIPSYISTLIGGQGAGTLQSLQELKTIGAMGMAVSGLGASATIGLGMGAVGGAIGGATDGFEQSRQNHPNSSMARAGGRALASGVGGAIGGAVGSVRSSFDPSRGSAFSGVRDGKEALKSGSKSALGTYNSLKSHGLTSQNVAGGNPTSLVGKKDGLTTSLEGASGLQAPSGNTHDLQMSGSDNLEPSLGYGGELQTIADNQGISAENPNIEGSQPINAESSQDIGAVDNPIDRSFTPNIEDHGKNRTGARYYGDLFTSRLNKTLGRGSTEEPSGTLLNGKPLNKK